MSLRHQISLQQYTLLTVDVLFVKNRLIVETGAYSKLQFTDCWVDTNPTKRPSFVQIQLTLLLESFKIFHEACSSDSVSRTVWDSLLFIFGLQVGVEFINLYQQLDCCA